jgi:hypothetical protein
LRLHFDLTVLEITVYILYQYNEKTKI